MPNLLKDLKIEMVSVIYYHKAQPMTGENYPLRSFITTKPNPWQEKTTHSVLRDVFQRDNNLWT